MQRVIPERNLGIIDVFNMSSEQNWVLREVLIRRSKLIASDPNLAVFDQNTDQNTPYGIEIQTEDGPIHYSFNLTADILIREREHVSGEYRFEVIESDPDAPGGGAGRVYKITTLADENDCLVLQTNKKRVVKVQTHTPSHIPIGPLRTEEDRQKNPNDRLQNEYLRTQQADHVHVKKPIIIENGQGVFISYMVMRDLLDMDVAEIIPEMQMPSPLTVDQLIELTILLWLGLDEQVFQNMLFHRDIKPANVRTAKDYLEACFIDFGLSADANGKYKKGAVGSPYYIAPERVFGKEASMQSEIFEFAVMLGELWGLVNFRGACSSAEEVFNMIMDREPVFDPNDLDVYRSRQFFADLTEQQVNQVFALFLRATDYEPQNRPNQITAVEVFEKIRLERLFHAENINKAEQQQSIIAANRDARSIRGQIALLQKRKKPDLFAQVNQLIITTLEKQGKNYGEREYKEFIHRLGIRAFVGLKNKEEIINKLNHINTELQKNQMELLALVEQVKVMERKTFANDEAKAQLNNLYTKLCTKLERAEIKSRSKGANIDELVAFNARMSTLLPEFMTSKKDLELAYKIDDLLTTHPEINSIINFLSQQAKECRFSLVGRKNMRKDFLGIIANGYTNDDSLKELLERNKNNFLIQMYVKKLSVSSVFLAEFKKLANQYIEELRAEGSADDKQIIDKIIQAKKFIDAKIKLTEIFSSEIAKLTQLSNPDNAKKIEELTTISNTVKSACLFKELDDLLLTIPPSLTATPYSFKMNKEVNSFKQALETFKDEYLTELLSANQVKLKVQH